MRLILVMLKDELAKLHLSLNYLPEIAEVGNVGRYTYTISLQQLMTITVVLTQSCPCAVKCTSL